MADVLGHDGTYAELNAELCARIRSGELTVETPGLLAALPRHGRRNQTRHRPAELPAGRARSGVASSTRMISLSRSFQRIDDVGGARRRARPAPPSPRRRAGASRSGAAGCGRSPGPVPRRGSAARRRRRRRAGRGARTRPMLTRAGRRRGGGGRTAEAIGEISVAGFDGSGSDPGVRQKSDVGRHATRKGRPAAGAGADAGQHRRGADPRRDGRAAGRRAAHGRADARRGARRLPAAGGGGRSADPALPHPRGPGRPLPGADRRGAGGAGGRRPRSSPSRARRRGPAALRSLEQKVLSATRAAARRRLAPDLEALLQAETIAVQAGPAAVRGRDGAGARCARRCCRCSACASATRAARRRAGCAR